jgi:hypothetical protein
MPHGAVPHSIALPAYQVQCKLQKHPLLQFVLSLPFILSDVQKHPTHTSLSNISNLHTWGVKDQASPPQKIKKNMIIFCVSLVIINLL